MTRQIQFQCQGDSPPSLDLLRLSIPLVRGVFPGHRYFALVSLVGDVDGLMEIAAVEGDMFPVARIDVRIAFQAHGGF